VTKRERVEAALARQPVDRPPVAFWQHAPAVDHDAPGLAEAMLDFHRRYDLDLIKVMSSGVYCVEDWGCRVAYTGGILGNKVCLEHAVKETADWSRIRPLDPGAGALGRELEAVRRIVAGRPDDAWVLHTLFTPLTIARKLAGDRLWRDLRSVPEVVLPALDAIAETMARYAASALDAGADGLFLATQTATTELVSERALESVELPLIRRVLAGCDGSRMTMLHVHGTGIYFDRLATLPVHAVNWHDRLTPPGLADGARRFPGAVVGGLDETTTLRTGSAAAIAAQADEAIGQVGGVGLIVAPGCGLPLDVPPAALLAALEAVRRHRR
jgi:uroporphyrinogen decarboxylase